MSVRAPYLTAGRLAATTGVLAAVLVASMLGALLVGPVRVSPWRALSPGGGKEFGESPAVRVIALEAAPPEPHRGHDGAKRERLAGIGIRIARGGKSV